MTVGDLIKRLVHVRDPNKPVVVRFPEGLVRITHAQVGGSAIELVVENKPIGEGEVKFTDEDIPF